VPSDREWVGLTDYLGGQTAAGNEMKSVSLWAKNGNGSNSSGIAGLPGGLRKSNGAFNVIGELGNWWSSSEFIADIAWYCYLNYGNGVAVGYPGSKDCGFSVRCVSD